MLEKNYRIMISSVRIIPETLLSVINGSTRSSILIKKRKTMMDYHDSIVFFYNKKLKLIIEAGTTVHVGK